MFHFLLLLLCILTYIIIIKKKRTSLQSLSNNIIHLQKNERKNIIPNNTKLTTNLLTSIQLFLTLNEIKYKISQWLNEK